MLQPLVLRSQRLLLLCWSFILVCFLSMNQVKKMMLYAANKAIKDVTHLLSVGRLVHNFLSLHLPSRKREYSLTTCIIHVVIISQVYQDPNIQTESASDWVSRGESMFLDEGANMPTNKVKGFVWVYSELSWHTFYTECQHFRCQQIKLKALYECIMNYHGTQSI